MLCKIRFTNEAVVNPNATQLAQNTVKLTNSGKQPSIHTINVCKFFRLPEKYSPILTLLSTPQYVQA